MFYFWNMRKLIAVFLFIVFIVNLSGIFILFKIRQSLIHSELTQMLQSPDYENKLIIISITSANKHLFEWEDEKEFRYNGIMYDVINKKYNAAGEMELSCIADEKETELWSDLTKLSKKNNSTQTEQNLVKTFGSVFIPSEKIFIAFCLTKSFVGFSVTPQFLSIEGDVLSPPPKSV